MRKVLTSMGEMPLKECLDTAERICFFRIVGNLYAEVPNGKPGVTERKTFFTLPKDSIREVLRRIAVQVESGRLSFGEECDINCTCIDVHSNRKR